ncbi:MAG: hypothetical protein R3F61_11830 [Myxococcota bacterium]
MVAFVPAASVLAPLTSLLEAGPDTLLAWAPVALAVLFAVGLVGTVAVVALALVLARTRSTRKAAAQ